MGVSPVRRRNANRALGNLGRTTLADRTGGGGHDDLIRRLVGEGGQPWKARTVRALGDLLDVVIRYNDETEGPASGDVLTWDASVDNKYGGVARFAPGGDGSKELFEDSGTGSFDEGSTYFQFSVGTVPIDPGYQLVLVNAFVTADTGIYPPVDGNPANGTVGIPTPWVLAAEDTTGAPGVLCHQGATGTGGAQVALWAHNDTDEQAPHTITASVNGTSFGVGYSFDITCTITIRTLHAPTA